MAMKNNWNQLQLPIGGLILLCSIIFSCKASKESSDDKKIDKAAKTTLRNYHRNEK